jgi:hypothetical protein
VVLTLLLEGQAVPMVTHDSRALPCSPCLAHAPHTLPRHPRTFAHVVPSATEPPPSPSWGSSMMLWGPMSAQADRGPDRGSTRTLCPRFSRVLSLSLEVSQGFLLLECRCILLCHCFIPSLARGLAHWALSRLLSGQGGPDRSGPWSQCHLLGQGNSMVSRVFLDWF